MPYFFTPWPTETLGSIFWGARSVKSTHARTVKILLDWCETSLASSHYLSTSASSTPYFEPNLNMVDLPKLVEGNNDNIKGEIHVAVNFVLYRILGFFIKRFFTFSINYNMLHFATHKLFFSLELFTIFWIPYNLIFVVKKLVLHLIFLIKLLGGSPVMDMLNPQSGRSSPSGGAGDSKSPTNLEGRPSSRLVRNTSFMEIS